MCTSSPLEYRSMPTKKPRIQVSLTVSQYELIKRLGKLQGRSMSHVLSELFDEIEPVYERVAVVLQAAVRAQSSMKEGFVESARRAEAEISPIVARAMGQLDFLVEGAEHRASGGAVEGGRPTQAASSAAAPPLPRTPAPVTRGSGLAKVKRNKGLRRSIKRDNFKSLQRLAKRIERGPKRGKRA
jgi:hypothetical protein